MTGVIEMTTEQASLWAVRPGQMVTVIRFVVHNGLTFALWRCGEAIRVLPASAIRGAA